MGIFDKIKDKVNSQQQASSSAGSASFPQVPTLPLGPESIPRYRKQRGLNLGSWFVLEKWIASSPYQNAVKPGESDFDVARGKDAKQIFERHWDEWIKEDDWQWIKDKGYNSVRIPIAYYHLSSVCPEVLKDTDFAPHAEVFAGAWARIEQAIQTAGRFGLGVLVDLHAAAGAQNADAHSGMSNGKPKLLGQNSNLRSTSLALRFLAHYLAPIPHVVGLEILNEPANDNRLQGFYEKTISELRPIVGPDFPLYVSDAWDTAWYTGWVGKRDDFVVLDHHLYRGFDQNDKKLSGVQHAQKLRNEFSGSFNQQCESAKGNVVVAEWSAGLDDWGKGMDDSERDRNKREFVKAQLELFNQCTAGWWWWTYKKGDGWDAGWSARDATTAEILPKWVGSRQFKGPPTQNVKDQELSGAHGSHSSYWKSHGGSPNPAAFGPGFSQGWDDALLFLSDSKGVSELGFASQWARRRKAEWEKNTGNKLGGGDWEWEHGFKQGVQACNRIALG